MIAGAHVIIKRRVEIIEASQGIKTRKFSIYHIIQQCFHVFHVVAIFKSFVYHQFHELPYVFKHIKTHGLFLRWTFLFYGSEIHLENVSTK